MSLISVCQDSDDGITVFDVTDPENASYCFMTTFGWKGRLPPFIPFNAEAYVRFYEPEPDPEEDLSDDEKSEANRTHFFYLTQWYFLDESDLREKDVLATIAALDDAPLITIDKLAEAWPNEYQSKSTPRTQVQHGAVPPVACLADLSVEPAVNHALEVGEIEALGLLLDMPGKAALMKNALQKRMSLPDSAIELVATLILLDNPSPKELDLSQWALTSEQVVKIVSEQANIESLCLSRNYNVTKTTILEVLSAKPTLRKIALLDTSVTDSDMVELLTDNPKLFYSFEAIIHPLFLQMKNIRPVAFTHIVCYHRAGVIRKRACAVSLPYVTPGQIVQALTDMLGSINNPYSEFELSGGFSVQAAYASELRQEGSPWAERTVPICLDRLDPSLGSGWNLVWQVLDHAHPIMKRYAFFLPCSNDLSGSAEDNDGKKSNAAAPPITYNIHDLKSFIGMLVFEGRPAPSHTALENLLAAFSAEFTLMTEQELAALATSWPMGEARPSPDYFPS